MTYDELEQLSDSCDREREAKRLRDAKSSRTQGHTYQSRSHKMFLRLCAEQRALRRQCSRLRAIGRALIRNDKYEGSNQADCGVDLRLSSCTRTNILPDGCSAGKVHFSWDGQTFFGNCPFCRFPLEGKQWTCACNGLGSTTGNKGEKLDRLLPFARQRKPRSGECEAVVDYFLHTMCRTDLRVLQVERLQNPAFIKKFRCGSSQKVMFHGCRTLENEEQILEHGFQVSQAVSYPKGTWLAGNASYSDGGYARYEHGIKHLFVCLVSDAEVVLDSNQFPPFWWFGADDIRVVGQDCAYPVWLVKYTNCEGISMHDELDGAWYEEGEDAEYERLDQICRRVNRRMSFRAQFEDVLMDAGRHRKSRSRGSDVMRGSGKVFQIKRYTEAPKQQAQKKVQDRVARMKQKVQSCDRRKAAGAKIQHLMNAM